jgi:hypothetical protein
LDHEFADLGLIQYSDDNEEQKEPGVQVSKKNSQHFLSSKNKYCISKCDDIEIIETTIVECDLESPEQSFQ